MYSQRLQRLRERMSELQLPALWITDSYNRAYMTGFTGSSGYVLVTLDRAFLLTDFRYRVQAKTQAGHCEIVEHASNVKLTILEILHELGIQQLAFEQTHLTYQDYLDYTAQLADIQFIPVKSPIYELRIIKDTEELRIMQEAAHLADAAFSHICTKLQPGISEKAIALELEIFIRQQGGTSTSFDTIVASGERSALPHGVASERKLQKNEFLTLDFGAYLKGYCSDLTRTVMMGQPSDKHRDVYQIVLEAQMNVLDHLKPGMTGAQGDALARDVIEHYGYGDQFGHGTGHGLGMQIHEAPRLSKQDMTILRPGMVVTVEPGIYLPGFGGVRIEDDVLITDTGIQRLTHANKQFLIMD